MSLADWFKARESRRYTPSGAPPGSVDVPEGVWVKCDSCNKTVYEGELEDRLRVCPGCGFHMELTAEQRITMLADGGTFKEFDAGMTSLDPLGFAAAKPYSVSLASAKEKSGLAEAVVCGRARIGGHDAVLAVMDFRFIGASMGSVVGEKVARAFETAIDERRAVVIVVASGGARMQEGMLSLMQMAKTAAAARRLSESGLPYVAVLTNPTMGGVTASFATLADIIFAEPGARVGFAGPRLVEQTIRRSVPKEFQSAESLLEHGMIDAVVHRSELTDRIALVLDYLAPLAGATPGGDDS